jgi:YfiH family protein
VTERLAARSVTVREHPSPASPFPLFVLREWEERFPGLRAGITAAAPDADFGISRAPSEAALRLGYQRLGAQLGFSSQAVARQVHGSIVVAVDRAQRRGLWLAGDADGLICDRSGVLCCVTAADCVPVYVLDVHSGALAILHAGWRGVAAGVLESGLGAMATRYGSRPELLSVHFGPAICGGCYEVGPEVSAALGLKEAEAGDGSETAVVPGTVDLRAELGRRAVRLGVRPGDITTSSWCTRCSSDQFHSYRGKGLAAGRMAAFLGWRRVAEP